MKLFDDEFINITKIRTVELYDTAEVHDGVKIKRFPPKLYSYELIYFKSGKRITRFGDRVLEEDAFALRFLPKDSDADIYTVEAVEDGECIDIYFDTDSSAQSAYRIDAYPMTFFIDREGSLVFSHRGKITYNALVEGIESIR